MAVLFSFFCRVLNPSDNSNSRLLGLMYMTSPHMTFRRAFRVGRSPFWTPTGCPGRVTGAHNASTLGRARLGFHQARVLSPLLFFFSRLPLGCRHERSPGDDDLADVGQITDLAGSSVSAVMTSPVLARCCRTLYVKKKKKGGEGALLKLS